MPYELLPIPIERLGIARECCSQLPYLAPIQGRSYNVKHERTVFRGLLKCGLVGRARELIWMVEDEKDSALPNENQGGIPNP